MQLNRRALAAGVALAGAASVVTCCVAPPANGPAPAAPPPIPAPAPTLPAPAPRPSPAPAAPAPANWMDAPQTSGDWRYAGNGMAQFGTGARPAFALTCRDGRIRLQRFGTTVSQGYAAMTLRTEFGNYRFDAPTLEGNPAADVPARDPALDAIAFTKGRFAVEVDGQPPLYLPSWPEVSRVVEDCRQ